MIARRVRLGLVACALFGVMSSAWAAPDLSAAELQSLLQAHPRAAVSYEEVRESPWLAAPITSRGSMRSTAKGLEKRVETPRQETWRLLDDRVEWQAADGAARQIPYAQSPALAALSNVLRRVVAGDLAALERDFELRVSGDARVWRAQLAPRSAELRRYLQEVELQGSGGQLQVIIVTERQDQKTTTRLGS